MGAGDIGMSQVRGELGQETLQVGARPVPGHNMGHSGGVAQIMKPGVVACPVLPLDTGPRAHLLKDAVDAGIYQRAAGPSGKER